MATNSPDSSNNDLIPIQKLIAFCAENKLPIPQFNKHPSNIGFYKFMVSLEIPVAGQDEPKCFEKEMTSSSRRKAEDEASTVMMTELQDWLSSNPLPDISRAKQDLNEFLKQYGGRFKSLKYEQERVESSYFHSKVIVFDTADSDKEYSELGKGRAKKDAEKDAAYRLLQTLKQSISEKTPPSPSEDHVELLKQKFVFPGYALEYQPYNTEDNCECLLKIWKLSIVKDDQPIITAAICTHAEDEGAKQLCADICLTNFEKIDQRLKENSSDQTNSQFD